MATTRTIYLSTDGKEFDTAAKADAHDAEKALQADLDAYVATLTFKTDTDRGLALSKSRVKKTIAGYLLWKQGVSEVKADEPADHQDA